MIAFDTTALSLLVIPNATVNSSLTKKPIKHARERLDALIERIAMDGDTILIPTPVLSEVLVKIPSRVDELLKKLRTSPWFRVESFDAAAAVELGLRTAKAMADGDKREGVRADWTKVKFDRQIVAIALVNQVSELISDDADVRAICERWSVAVKSIGELPIPSELIPPPLIAAVMAAEEEDKEKGNDKPRKKK